LPPAKFELKHARLRSWHTHLGEHKFLTGNALTVADFAYRAIEDSLVLAEMSQRDGIMIAPGAVFRPHLERSPWMRFNVSICEDVRVERWLQRQGTVKTK
jgi:hypothetical protein